MVSGARLTNADLRARARALLPGTSCTSHLTLPVQRHFSRTGAYLRMDSIGDFSWATAALCVGQRSEPLPISTVNNDQSACIMRCNVAIVRFSQIIDREPRSRFRRFFFLFAKWRSE